MKNWMKGFACVAVAAVLSACGQKGSEYVGNWQAKEHKNRTAAIEKNGDNYLIKVTEPSMFERNKLDTVVLPAVYKDGLLEVSGVFGTSKVSYVKDTDTLLMPTNAGSMEYRRVK